MNSKTKTLVGIGLFTAIVVVLQLLGAFIKLGLFSISLVLVPIVVGAAVYGWKCGVWLGFAFGATVLISGDAAAFFAVNELATIFVVLAKGVCSGLAAGLIYHAIKRFNKILAVLAAAVICPVVNTGIFLLGCQLFFMPTIRSWAAAEQSTVVNFVIFGLGILNFPVELGINLVLSPVITRLIKIGEK